MESTKPVELKFITPWGSIAGKAWGKPSQSPVLAIHGFHDNAGSFDHVIPLLPSDFYFVCLDLPGHGLSSPYPMGVSTDFFACLRDVCRILQCDLKWPKYTLLSHSAGGHICLFIASIYPEMVEKVVLIDMFFYFVILDDNEICHRIRYLFDQSFRLESLGIPECSYTDENKALETFLKNHFSPISKQSATKLLSRIIRKEKDGTFKVCNDRRRYLTPVPILTLDFHLAVIRNIQAPILTITFSETEKMLEKVPSNYETTKVLDKVMGSKLKKISVQGSHNVHLDFPEKIAFHISKFLKDDPMCSL